MKHYTEEIKIKPRYYNVVNIVIIAIESILMNDFETKLSKRLHPK